MLPRAILLNIERAEKIMLPEKTLTDYWYFGENYAIISSWISISVQDA